MDPAEIAQNFFKHKQRADFLIEVGRYREALSELVADLALYPEGYHSLCQSAYCQFQLSEYQAAYDLTKKAVAAAPEEEWAYRLQSMTFSATGDNRRALEAAEKSVHLAPNYLSSLHTLVYAQVGVWKLLEAEKTVAQMLEISPDDANAHDAAGYVALKKEEYEKAEKHYQTALKIDPESVSALNNLGVVYLEYANAGKGKEYRKRSADLFERAVRVQPTFVSGQENLKIATTVAKAGVPIGTILLACWAVNSIANAGRHGAALLPDLFQSLTFLSPHSPNYLLFGFNLLSIGILTALTAFAIKYYFSKNREKMIRSFRDTRTWVIIAISLLFPLVFYIVFLILLDVEAGAFSYLALILLFLASLYALLQVILHIQLRQTK